MTVMTGGLRWHEASPSLYFLHCTSYIGVERTLDPVWSRQLICSQNQTKIPDVIGF